MLVKAGTLRHPTPSAGPWIRGEISREKERTPLSDGLSDAYIIELKATAHNCCLVVDYYNYRCKEYFMCLKTHLVFATIFISLMKTVLLCLVYNLKSPQIQRQ